MNVITISKNTFLKVSVWLYFVVLLISISTVHLLDLTALQSLTGIHLGFTYTLICIMMSFLIYVLIGSLVYYTGLDKLFIKNYNEKDEHEENAIG